MKTETGLHDLADACNGGMRMEVAIIESILLRRRVWRSVVDERGGEGAIRQKEYSSNGLRERVEMMHDHSPDGAAEAGLFA